ncbi:MULTISPECIES: hypothetical protein [unclassified Acinetobacter]|uniref:hypothetical protein n=1 Tax=unclassified Acinetobacter TaxID=196816 RepID=UPI0025B8DCD2|nr:MULTISPECIES: hypothetical protein [unclassified Acinetobacter]
MKILIGIDTGVHTGFAVAIDHGNGGELEQVESLSITQAMEQIRDRINSDGKDNIFLYIEDARKRTWFGSMDARQAKSGAGVREGVGSVKRDAQIWEDWCKEQDIHFKMIHPAANATKKKADDFKRMTGWTGRTNEHARDAAMLVFKRFWKV